MILLYCIYNSMANSARFIWHSIIVGGGASGLFCASKYAAPKLLLEHNARPGAKLAVTGGGKCNFSNLNVTERDYVCQSKHFCHAALAAFRPRDFICILEEEKIPFDTLQNGQLFAQNAREITQLLVRCARTQNTDIRCKTEVLKIQKENGLFRVTTSEGTFYTANLVLATGGLSYPDLGATGFAFRTAQELGLNLVPLRPALAGLRAPDPLKTWCRQLAGNSIEAEITVGKRIEKGSLLFTHEGFSGPAVLQASLYWQEAMPLRINFLPGTDVLAWLQKNKNNTACFSKILAEFLPAKIAKTLLQENDVRAADAKKETLLAAARRLNALSFQPTGTSGYTRAEVTAGGVDTVQFSPASMECKSIAGLFYIGEALDVTGRLGGYNLHWAWASAAAAARALARR